jgi:hypothetical protein
MPQRNVKLDDFEADMAEIRKRDSEILDLFKEQIDIFSMLIKEQKGVNQSYLVIIQELEKRIRQLEIDFLAFRGANTNRSSISESPPNYPIS